MRWIVELRGAARVHDGPPRVRALGPVDLRIGSGEHVALTGPSGAGKSTLLQLVGLLDLPTSGDVVFAGQAIDRGTPPRTVDRLRAAHVGMVFQSFHLLPGRTARENVELGLLYRRVPARRRRDLADRALADVGLADRAAAPAEVLSGGEQQRVAVARALVARPTLLLCDEPTGNLDRASGVVVLDLLDRLRRSGATLVVATHDPAVAERAGRRIALLDGEVQAA